jgi:predicted ArsR family transcriptional regulator
MPRTTASPDEVLLSQSRALGDPTRNAVFVYLRDAPGPVGVGELTAHFGLNHNAIRQHLAKLEQAGLVVAESSVPTGPGRPPRRYRPTPGAAERWGGTSPFETLAMLLLELLHSGRPPLDVGREAGRRLAAEHGRRADAVEVLDAVARRLGFEPELQPTRTGVDVVLRRCPFVGPASASPGVVCELHRGIAEGIAEHATGDAEVHDLVIRDPRRAGCRIKVAAAS